MVQNSVATFVTNPEAYPLTLAHINELQVLLQEAGCLGVTPDWLADNAACDIKFDSFLHEHVAKIITPYLAEKPIDWSIQHTESRKKKLILSDMDSTMIAQECIDELAAEAGIGEKVADITERAMNGELDFTAALEERIGLLTDLPESVLEKVYAERITLSEGAKTLIATMRANGAYAMLVSGGFTFFTERVGKALGFDADEANILDFANGALTGNVIKPVLDKHAKEATLNRLIKELDITAKDTTAIGDGANDLPMLIASGLGIAYRGKPIVQGQSDAAINHTDLTTLLYFQGYTSKEFTQT